MGMDKTLENYVRWRFRVNNTNHYQQYLDEWLKNITETQINYFREEMCRLIGMGKYAPC